MSEAFWLEYAHRNEDIRKVVKNSLDFLLEDIPKDCTILDIGCNNGSFLSYIQSLGYYNLTGMDSNPDVIDMARELHPDMDFILEDVINLDRKFDLIISDGLLIHIPPKDLITVIRLIFNNSKKYVMGFEYYNDVLLTKVYRGTIPIYRRNYVMLIKNLSI